eukprot:TRINITY_DN8427_c0_g1_i2.p1 TRINITY_DN8427_c0_g1~~TRINITY_DN8427_c0_g1_i2.p1  ORF type:complete len:786 (+),score=190.00 TRINITY_DN8427_c0_g1_i2:42-2399(+)
MSGEEDHERTSGAGEKIAMKLLEEECEYTSTPPQAPPPVPSVLLAGSPARVSQSPAASAETFSVLGAEPLPLELPQPPAPAFAEELQPAMSPVAVVAPERLPEKSPEITNSALLAEMALQAAINAPHVQQQPAPARGLYANISSPKRKSKSPPRAVDAPRYVSTRRSLSTTSVRSASGNLGQAMGVSRRAPPTFKRTSSATSRPSTRRHPTQPNLSSTSNTIARSMNISPSTFQGDVIAALEKELLEVTQQAYTSKNAMEDAERRNVAVTERLRAAHERISSLESIREDDRRKWLATVESWRVHLHSSTEKHLRDKEGFELRLSAYEQQSLSSDGLTQVLHASDLRNKELLAEVDLLRKQLADSEVTKKVLAEEAENSKKDVVTTTHEASLIAEQVTLQQQISEGLRDELATCKTEKEGLEGRIQQLHNQIELLTEKGAITISQLTVHNEELEAQIQKSTAAHKSEIDLLSEEHRLGLEKLVADNSDSLANVERKWTETVAKLQQETTLQIEQYEEAVNTLKNDAKMTAKKQAWEIDAIRKDFSEALKSQRETAAENSQRDEDLIAGLKAELIDCEKKLADAHAQFEINLSESEDKNLTKTKEHQLMSNKLAQLESQIQQYSQEAIQNASTISALESEVNSLKIQLSEQTVAQREQETQLRAAADREALLRSEKQADVIKITSLSEQLLVTTTESESLMTQLNQSQRRSEHSKQATETLERQTKRHLSESERLKAALDIKDQHLEAARSKVIELQIELEHYRAQTTSITSPIGSASFDLCSPARN